MAGPRGNDVERALGWLREGAVTAGLVARQSTLSLRSNWGIGLLSLALALSLWVYVTDRENPERTDRVPGSVPIEVVNVPAGLAVLSVSQESVTVRARASESVLDGLTAQEFRATLDLAGVTTQEVRGEVRVTSEEPRADVVDVSPAFVTVRLENVRSQTVPVSVQLVGALPRGFEVGETTIQPAEAEVTGPETLVASVASLVAEVNLTGARTSFEETLALKPRDEAGLNIERVRPRPESAQVRVQITQVQFTQGFVVRPEVTGVPAEGYQVTAVRADPPLVNVTGTIEQLQGIDAVAGLATAAVSVEGATADVVRPMALLLPAGVTAGVTTVTVRATVAATQGQFTFSVAPQLLNAPAGLNASLSPGTVQVVLAGPAPALLALQVTDIVAALDLSGLGAGEHQAPVRIQAPGGAVLVSVTPAIVRVTLAAP